MANFFKKPQLPASPSSGEAPSSAGPSTPLSDFKKAFRPFVVKKDAQLAPSNWFLRDAEQKIDDDISIMPQGGRPALLACNAIPIEEMTPAGLSCPITLDSNTQAFI
jgi:hypothetical protein